MKRYTVTSLAKLAGITVRALHHYDAIGLLKPAETGANGYRYYGPAELRRLQEIMFHRELGLPLAEIGRMLDAGDDEKLATFEFYRGQLAAEAKRSADLLATIDRTIADLKGERAMRDDELYTGFTPEKQAEYEAWLIDTYGGDMEEKIAASKKAYAKMTTAEQQAAMDELKAVETALAEGMKRGAPPQAQVLDPLLNRHRAWVGLMWGAECAPDAYAGLADLYQTHADFRARYETIAEGFTDWLADAMKAYARRVG